MGEELTKEEVVEWAYCYEFHRGPAVMDPERNGRWVRAFIFRFHYDRPQMAQIIRQRYQIKQEA